MGHLLEKAACVGSLPPPASEVPREDTPEMMKRLAQSPLSVSEDCASESLGPWLGRVWFLQWVWFLKQNQGLPSLFPSGIACSPLLLFP